ncbi:MAG: hypothetical protein ACK58L_03855 [Planctomycetota bacterium]
MSIASRLMTSFVAVGLLLGSDHIVAAAENGETGSKSELISTHKQVRVIKPMHEGQPITLNTFCLDKRGNILACVGGDSFEYVMNEDGSQQAKKVEAARLLQVYAPEGELVRSVELTFKPTAINQAPDGSLFVAGEGKIAHLSEDGKVLSTADSPHIGDMETFRQRVEEGAKKQIAEMTQTFTDQIASIEKRIAALRGKPEAEWTEKDKKRLVTYEQQKALYETQAKSMKEVYSEAFSGDQMLTQKMGITAVAVTGKDVFLCCNSLEGYGYEVWRMTHEFSEPKKVVTELGGCCGQCDIQATEDYLVLAENTKFKVAMLNRDGERLLDFGRGDRKASDGFGSCCNPMNVRCCDNGDVLTAESSIGTIKRFNKKGELIGIVGKDKIGGGCKHVALGFDAQLDRYYMMNVDKSHICVLVPNSEAPETTPEEQLAKEAREGLAQKLIGEWSIDGKRPKAAASSDVNAVSVILGSLLGSSTDAASDPYASSFLKFEADGRLTTTGGQSLGEEMEWEAIRQEGNTLYVSQIQDSIQYYEYKIEFVSDDEATITLMFSEQVLSSNRFRRVAEDASESDDAAEELQASEAARTSEKVDAPSDDVDQ